MQTINNAKSQEISDLSYSRYQSKECEKCSDSVIGTKTVLSPLKGTLVKSFLLTVRVAVKFVHNCQQSAGRCMRMNYWFSLVFWLERVCSLFPSNSFHLPGNKCKHQFNLSLLVSDLMIHCVCKTSNNLLIIISTGRATVE